MDLIKDKHEIDIAFVLLHGRMGEDGSIQGMLKILGIPFVGSDVLASAMSLNKKIAKSIYRASGLMVAKDVILEKKDKYSAEAIIQRLGEKVVVKPVCEGSSIGTSICNGEKELLRGIELAFSHDTEVMVEEYLEGREVTCGIMGNRDLVALPLVEIIPGSDHSFFDYRAKYTPGATREICPAQIPDSLAKKAQDVAKRAHRGLQCRVWSRTDMIIKGDDIYVLETNTIPGMTETSLFPLSAKQAGISMPQLLERLIDLSLEGD
jgi:D-alanine-D-alanine ligase